VILSATNEQLGIMKLQDALRRAQGLGLDLVEVAPGANPPVCKIVDFGKYRYDLSKQDKDRKSTGSKLKEIKFRVNIDPHDYMIKVRHAEEFLDKGNKVKCHLQFRGRELSHKSIGMTISPLPSNKRKRRFAPPTEELPPDEPDDDSEE
jgi:translation initiation factor IF-3